MKRFWLSLLVLAGLLRIEVGFSQFSRQSGGVIRGDTESKRISLVFTGHEFGEGGSSVLETLEKAQVKASFFFTGDFYRNPGFRTLIERLKGDSHYLGGHSDKHLLYCDWTKRDSLLVTKAEFLNDLEANYAEMRRFGIRREEAGFFLPPYEWYNDSISAWTAAAGLQLINFSPGTRSAADYTTPSMKNYRSSAEIYDSILGYEDKNRDGLNGFILLLHLGAGPERQDKFYERLPALIQALKNKGYSFVRIDQLLK